MVFGAEEVMDTIPNSRNINDFISFREYHQPWTQHQKHQFLNLPTATSCQLTSQTSDTFAFYQWTTLVPNTNCQGRLYEAISEGLQASDDNCAMVDRCTTSKHYCHTQFHGTLIVEMFRQSQSDDAVQ